MKLHIWLEKLIPFDHKKSYSYIELEILFDKQADTALAVFSRKIPFDHKEHTPLWRNSYTLMRNYDTALLKKEYPETKNVLRLYCQGNTLCLVEKYIFFIKPIHWNNLKGTPILCIKYSFVRYVILLL